MEESGSLARSFHLPPVEIASDRSSFKNLEPKNWPRNLLSTINKIIVRLDCVEPELTLQNKCEEHIVSLLILCGENFIAAEWNNAQVVHQADKAFHSLARVLDIQTPAEIFKLERIALLLFNELKIKINKDDMKRYPASAYCFTWAVNFLSVS